MERPSDPTPQPDATLLPLDAFKFAQQFREYHHRALWEEEKHFTWLLSIVLAAQAAVLTAKGADLPARSPLLVALALVGIAFVVVALVVVRREGSLLRQRALPLCASLQSTLP
jgi:hypothetical protein